MLEWLRSDFADLDAILYSSPKRAGAPTTGRAYLSSSSTRRWTDLGKRKIEAALPHQVRVLGNGTTSISFSKRLAAERTSRNNGVGARCICILRASYRGLVQIKHLRATNTRGCSLPLVKRARRVSEWMFILHGRL